MGLLDAASVGASLTDNVFLSYNPMLGAVPGSLAGHSKSWVLPAASVGASLPDNVLFFS
jgi:hypothetical protein